jgi:hypothetical protein
MIAFPGFFKMALHDCLETEHTPRAKLEANTEQQFAQERYFEISSQSQQMNVNPREETRELIGFGSKIDKGAQPNDSVTRLEKRTDDNQKYKTLNNQGILF